MGRMTVLGTLTVITAMIVSANGFVSKIDFVTGGVYEKWAQENALNVQNVESSYPSFAFVHGDAGRRRFLWLISRRINPKVDASNADWDPSIDYSAVRGGIVSTYTIDINGWQHQSFDRLDPDELSESIFSIRGQLFLLAYSTDQGKAIFEKLFVWDDQAGKWNSVATNVDPLSATVGNLGGAQVRVNVPDHDDNMVYVVSTVMGEASVAKLEITFDDSQKPTEAKLNSIAHFNTLGFRVVFTAYKDQKLNCFVTVGGSRVINIYYIIDLSTGQVTNSTHGITELLESEDFIFQDKDRVYLLGRRKTIEHHPTKNVLALDLTTLKTFGDVVRFPDFYPIKVTYDPKRFLLYSANTKGGIFVSNVSQWF